MPIFIGVIDLSTKKKQVIALSSPLLPYGFNLLANISAISPPPENLACGAYRAFIADGQIAEFNCKTCNGTGGHEEVSGGHKKMCEDCFGQGLDPVLLDRFEKSKGMWQWHKIFTTHEFCSDCTDIFRSLPEWWGVNEL